MSAIRASWKNGQIIPEEPANWPEGLHLLVEPAPTDTGRDDTPVTPEEIARTLAAMDKIEPFEMTAEEKADLDAWEKRVSEYGIANMDEDIEDIFR